MKKTIAFGLISIFLLSLVPFAFAESGAGRLGDKLEDIRDEKEDVRDAKEDVRDRLNIDRQNCIARCTEANKTLCEAKCRTSDKMENVRDRKEDIRDKMEDRMDKMKRGSGAMIKVKTLADLKLRKIDSAKIEEFKEKFEVAKEKFKLAKDELKDAKDKLKEARGKNDKNATLENAKQYLVKISDVLINNLEKIKVKVQENENIPQDRVDSIVTAIDAQIGDINDIKTQAQAATTKEQVKELAKKLRDKWNKYQNFARLYAYRVISARVEGIVNQGLVLEKRLDLILNKTKEKGITVDVDAEVAEFKADIQLARDKFKSAQDKLTQALDLKLQNATNSTVEKVKQLTEEAKGLLKESRDALKAAHDVLKDIVRKIKEAMPEANLSEETEVEVEDVSEDETEANATAST